MSYRAEMEAAFEEWFQAHRRETWTRSRIAGDPIEPRQNWSMGHYWLLREGWMGAVLWCRLCKREHEGPCISTAESRS